MSGMKSADERSEAAQKSEEATTVGTLTIRYIGDTPVITLNNGTAVPDEIVVVDTQGNPVARYTSSALPADPATRTQVQPEPRNAVASASSASGGATAVATAVASPGGGTR